MTERLERFGLTLGETARAWRNKLDQRLRPLGLSQAKWLVLLHLAKSSDTLVQKELAGRVGVEGPTLVRLLDRMAADGWIERRDSASDRRSKTVHLTRKARAVAQRIEAVARQLRQEVLADIPAADLGRALDVLMRIRRRIEHV